MEEKITKQNPTKVIALVIASLLVLALLGFLVYSLLFAAQSTPKATLEQFYSALYEIDGDYDDMRNAIIESERINCDWAYTQGGMDYTVLRSNRVEAIDVVGENVDVRIEIVEQIGASSSVLQTVKKTYPQAVDQTSVLFRVIVEGDQYEMGLYGMTTLVKVGSKWYMPQYVVELTREFKNEK